MSSKGIIANAFKSIPKEHLIFAKKLGEISDRIGYLMELRGIKSQKQLAQLLGKRESEISKWLNTSHNMTLKTLSKIEAVLEADVIKVVDRQGFVPVAKSCIRLSVRKKPDMVEVPDAKDFAPAIMDSHSMSAAVA